VLLATRPRRIIAFAHRDVPASRGGAAWHDGEHEVARWCRLLAHAGILADATQLELDPLPLPAAARACAGRDLTVVHPGAKDAARRWPVERWAAIARSEQRRGRVVLLTGDPSERRLAAQVAAAALLQDDANLAGRTDLVGLAGLVAHAGRVVCGDTGIAHLATALRTPSVVLFGPVSPALWGPPPERPWHRALWAGRNGDPHGSSVDPGLLEIGVGDVIAALETLPAAPRDARRRAA
jgi:ADP-heptose:LPS heptosyltransferase